MTDSIISEETQVAEKIQSRGVHGEKLVAALKNQKLPSTDKSSLQRAIIRYDKWIKDIQNVNEQTIEQTIEKLVELLNEYKLFIDLELIFDSPSDFLYRQKGQLKLDNTVLEEFLSLFVKKCLDFDNLGINIEISSQAKVFSSLYFDTDLQKPSVNRDTGMRIKVKDQDFSISKPLYLSSSFNREFNNSEVIETRIGFILAETKTNLDKTMFQEASATARDVKMAVTGAKYFLICEFLDMTPISSITTNIDRVLVLRKAKRLSSNVRSKFSNVEGRKANRESYKNYLTNNPFDKNLFEYFYKSIKESFTQLDLDETEALSIGYF